MILDLVRFVQIEHARQSWQSHKSSECKLFFKHYKSVSSGFASMGVTHPPTLVRVYAVISSEFDLTQRTGMQHATTMYFYTQASNFALKCAKRMFIK